MSYLDYSGRPDRLSGGARRIPVDTPAGQFTVWTKRIGNNPDLKVLLLHGGPGATLVIGARYDTMDPAHMEMMAGRLPKGRYLYCPNGSHLAMYDDQDTYFAGLTDFLATLPA